MTPQEREARIRELKIQQLKVRQQQIAVEQAEIKREEDYDPGLRERGTAVLQGLTWNAGDELTAAAAATFGGVGEGWGERYKDILEAENARQDEYSDRRPGEALALELGGGLLTRRPGLKKGVDKLFRRTEKVAAKRAANAAERSGAQDVWRKVFKNTLGGAGEGAVAGFMAGRGDVSDRLGSATAGAGIGAAIPLGLSTGRQLARTIGRRRIKPEIGRGEDFVPPHMLMDKKENWLSDLYRNVGGKGLFTRPTMAVQEAKVLQADKLLRKDAKLADREAVDMLEEATRKKQEMGGVVKQEAEGIRRAAEEEFEAGTSKLKRTMEKRSDELEGWGERQVDSLDDRALNQTKAAAGQTAEDIGNSNKRFFQRTAYEAMPSRVGDDVRQQVAQMEPQDAARFIDDWWKKEAFKGAKSEHYKWDGNEGLVTDMRRMVADDPEIVLELGDVADAIPGMAARMQNAATRGLDPSATVIDSVGEALTGKIELNGDAMMALRNVYARAANTTKSVGRQRYLNRVKGEFDDAIRKTLREKPDGKKLVADFDEDLKRYGVKQNFVNAVDSRINDVDGWFEPIDFLKANTTRQKRYGTMPLQQEAASARDAAARLQAGGKQARQDIIESTGVQKKSVGRKQKRMKRDATREASALRKTLAQSRKAETTRAGKVGTTRMEEAEALVKNRRAERKASQRSKQDITEMTAERKARGIQAEPSPFQIAFATGLGGFWGPLMATAPGSRAMFGQTSAQKAGQRAYSWLLRNEKPQKAIRGLTDRARQSYIREEAAEQGRYR